METSTTSPSTRLEVWFSGALAVFATVLAMNELGAGRYGEDEIKLANEKTSAYLWYQSKGIKESLAEGQQDLIASMVTSNAIKPDHLSAVKDLAAKLTGKIERYGKEKTEILLGSATVGKANWAQEVDGKLGAVVGAKEIEALIAKLSKAGDSFDIATLCLQLCLVLGALGLLLKVPTSKKLFLIAMFTLGCVGSALSVHAYWIALF